MAYSFYSRSVQEHYDLVRPLGGSDRGSVELLRHRQSGQRCVLRRFQGSAAVYERLLPLSSPNLPRIYAAAEQDGQVLVLEEYIEGDRLDQLLEAGTLTVRQARGVMKDLCSALWVLHSLGAVHRDVKPENVILRGSEAVLIDFDASRVSTEGQAKDTMILGTTGYAAPEQFGIGQTDCRADIYALGITLNVMLTGQHPSVRPAAGRMGRIVRRCTMMAPQNRYKDVSELLAVL